MLLNWCNAACRNLVKGALMRRYARSGRFNIFRRPHSSYAGPACKLRVLRSCVVGSFAFLVKALVVSGAGEIDARGRGRVATPPGVVARLISPRPPPGWQSDAHTRR